MRTWTKEEYKQEIDTLYKDMKPHGWTKGDCTKEIKRVIKENNITITKS